MTYPTDAAIEAGAKALWLCDEGSYQDHPLPWVLCCDRYPGTADRYRDMTKAALIAARAAEPMPSMAEVNEAINLFGDKRAEYRAALIASPLEECQRLEREASWARIALRDLFRRATGEGVGE